MSLIGKVRGRLTRSTFVKNAAWVAGGGALGQIATAIGLLIAARLYGPKDFGALGYYAGIVGIIGASTTLRYDLAIPIAEDEKEAADCLALSLLSAVITSIIAGLVFILFGHLFLAKLGAGALIPLTWTIGFGLLGTGAYNAFSYLATRHKEFKALGATRASQGLWTSVVQVGIGFFQHTAFGLVVGHMAGRWSGVRLLAKSSQLEDGKWFLGQATKEGMKAAASKYRRFPMFSTLASALNTAGLMLPPMLVTKLYGEEAAGHMTLSQRVVGLPVALVVAALSQVFLGEASRLLREDPDRLLPLFNRLTRTSFFAGLGLIALCLLGPLVTVFLFGPQWGPSGMVIAIIGVTYAGLLVVSPISSVAGVAQRQDLQLYADVFRVVMIVGSFVGAHAAKLDMIGAVAVYSAGSVVAYAGYYAMYRWVTMDEVRRKKEAAAGIEQPKPEKSKSLMPNNLDLIRLLAAFQVLVYHSKWFLISPGTRTTMEAAIATYAHETAGGALEVGTGRGAPSLANVLFNSLAGVPIFFIISGFLITLSFERSPDIRSYFRNRVLRIYPGLWLAILVILAAGLIAGQGPAMASQAGSTLGWVLGQATGFYMGNPDSLKAFAHGHPANPLWTIMVELEFYLFVPFLYWVGKKFGIKPTMWAFLGLGILVSQFGERATGQNEVLRAIVLHPALHVYWMFVLGALLRLYFDKIRPLVEGKGLLWLIIHVVLVAVVHRFGSKVGLNPSTFWGNTANPLAMGVLGFAILGLAYSARGLSQKLLRGNDMSYGIYIFNMPIVCLALHFGLTGKMGFLVITLASFALSYASWKLVESPVLRRKQYTAKA